MEHRLRSLRHRLSAALFFLIAIDPAHSVPVAAVAAVIGVAATTFVAIAVTVVLNIGLAILANKLFAPKLTSQSQERQAAATTVQLGEQPRMALFGQAAIAGTLLDAFDYGGQYGTDWEVLVLGLADHRCKALVSYFANDTSYPFVADGIQPGFNGQLGIWWLPGTMDQTIPAVLTANSDWTADDNLAGVCGVVVAYKADAPSASNPTWASGRPTFLWVLQGAYCYDARKDSTVTGSSGAHRYADPSTWEWSENPIVCRYNWVRGIYAGDQIDHPEMLLIGRGLSESEAPAENVAAYANVCDEQVPDGAGGNENRYRIGGSVSSADDYITTEEMFAAACAGIIIQPGGSVEIEPGHAKSIVATITDDDILSGVQLSYSAFRSETDTAWVNTVIPRYVEPTQKWADHAAPIRRIYGDVIDDGKPREDTLSLAMVPFAVQAQRCGEIARRLGRLTKTATIPLGPRFARIEEGDWIAWQSNRRFGGGARVFRVDAYGLSKEWRNTLQIREIAASAFNWTAIDGLSDGASNAQQTSPNPAAYGLLAALIAQSAEAAENAQSALEDLQAIASDNVLSTGEKSAVILDWQAVFDEQGGIVAKASALGVSSTDYAAAYSALSTYLGSLSPLWNDLDHDTPIDGPTFRSKWSTYYAAKIALLNALTAKAATTANWSALLDDSGGLAYLESQAATGFAHAQSALATLANIASENVLTVDKKPAIIQDWTVAYANHATLIAQAQALGVAYADYDTKTGALSAKLGAVGPVAWDDLSADSPVDGPSLRGAFLDYYTAEVALEAALSAKAATTAQWSQIGDDNGGKAALQALAAQAASYGQQALAQIVTIGADDILSKGEKRQLITDWSVAYAEHAYITAQAQKLGIDISAYDTAINNWAAFLGAMNPAWDDVSQDSPTNGVQLTAYAKSYYDQRTLLLQAMTAQQQGVSIQTSANLFTDQRFERISSAEWQQFSGWVVQGATDGQRIYSPANVGADCVALAASYAVNKSTELDFDLDYLVTGDVPGSGGFGVATQFFRADGSYITGLALAYNYADVSRDDWLHFTGRIVCAGLPGAENFASAHTYLFAQSHSAGLAYIRSPRGIRVATALANIGADGRALTSALQSTNLLVGATNTVTAICSAADQGGGSGAVITVPAHIRTYAGVSGQVSISYNGGTLPNCGYDTTYFVYCDDPSLAGGAVSYFATTNADELTYSSGRYHVGTIRTPAAAAPATSGSGGAGSSTSPVFGGHSGDAGGALP